MNVVRTVAALVATTALVAAPIGLALPAQADADRSGGLPGGGRYQLSVDREDGGFQVSADLDDTAPGSRWKVVLRHEGKKIASGVLAADDEGDLSVDRFRRDTAGADRFALTVTPAAGGQTSRAVVTR